MLAAVEARAVLAVLGCACARLRAVLAPSVLAAPTAAVRGGVRGRPAHEGAGRKELSMLRIYGVLLELVRDVGPLVRQLERKDADLARQCRRALASAPLNVAEGSYSRGMSRPARYQTAVGSLREVLSCLEVAEALGYLPSVDGALRSRFDHVIGTLVRVVGGHRR